MNILKKVTCGAIAVAMAAGMTGCMDASWIIKSGDTKLPSGVYVANMLENYLYGYMYQGTAYLNEEGVPEALVDSAKEYCETILAYKMKADELGLTLTEEELAAVKSDDDMSWEDYSALYQANRVSQEAYDLTYEVSALSAKVFDAIYGENGTNAVPVEELRSIYDENYIKAGLMIFDKPAKVEISETSTEEQKKEVQDTYEASLADLRAEAEYWVAQAEAMMGEERGLTFNDVMIAYDMENTPLESNDNINVGNRYAYIDKRTEAVPAEVMEYLESAEVNAVEIVETEEYLVICCLQDGANDEDFEAIRTNILLELKGDEMQQMMEDYLASLNIEYNEAALKRFTPDKLVVG